MPTVQEAPPRPRTPAPELQDWENEGGATPPSPSRAQRGFFERTERRVKFAGFKVSRFIRKNPGAAVAAAFGVGIVVGGGLRHVRFGRMILAIVSQPIMARVSHMFLAKG